MVVPYKTTCVCFTFMTNKKNDQNSIFIIFVIRIGLVSLSYFIIKLKEHTNQKYKLVATLLDHRVDMQKFGTNAEIRAVVSNIPKGCFPMHVRTIGTAPYTFSCLYTGQVIRF